MSNPNASDIRVTTSVKVARQARKTKIDGLRMMKECLTGAPPLSVWRWRGGGGAAPRPLDVPRDISGKKNSRAAGAPARHLYWRGVG